MLWKARGTRSCIRVHGSGALGELHPRFGSCWYKLLWLVWIVDLHTTTSEDYFCQHIYTSQTLLLNCLPKETRIHENIQPRHMHIGLFKICSQCTKHSHWAFITAICFWEATFSYKSYHLSDCYRLYIRCKNNIGKTLNYQTELSDWYQLYISCKIKIEISITLSNRYETIRSINYKTDDGYSCNHAEWVISCSLVIIKYSVSS